MKTYFDGVHKVRPPAETCRVALSALESLDPDILEGYTQIVHPSGVPHYRVRGTAHFRRVTGTWRTSGKGHSSEQALASGLMELIERFSCYTCLEHAPGATHGPRAHVQGDAMSFDDLVSCYYDPPQDGQLSWRGLETTPLTWFPGRTLQDEPIAIPARLVTFVLEGTNGMAAGNTLEEALLHGLLEVLERHCQTHVRVARRDTPHIDPATIDSSLTRDVLERLEDTGEHVTLRDFSLGTNVPVIAAVRRLEDARVQVTVGSATTREEAALRAITENVQTQGLMNCYPVEAAAHYLDATSEPASFDSVRDIDDANIRNELDTVAGLLRAHGMRAAYIDATQRELGLPAVMTFVFGAQFQSDDLAQRSFLVGSLHDARLGTDRALSRRLAASCVRREEAGRAYAELSLALDEVADGALIEARRRLLDIDVEAAPLPPSERTTLAAARARTLAHVSIAIGDPEGARAACLATMTADPTITAAYVRVAAPVGIDVNVADVTSGVFGELKDFWLLDGRSGVEQTLAAYHDFMAVRPELVERVRVGERSFDARRYTEALAQARAALATQTVGAELLRARWLAGRCLARLERWPEAVAELEGMRGLQFDDPRYVMLLELCRKRAARARGGT